jgi:F420-non-reducing hydrogenase iron-sulfur subunit
MGFEPKIIGFFCNWCAYAGADLAGIRRIQYPPNLRIIRVLCTGGVDITYILEAFRQGIDGVLVAGCHLGDCHYQKGNLKARKRIAITKKYLKELGLHEKRLRLEWISAGEGEKLGKIVKEMVVELKRLGPNPWKKVVE